MIFTTNGFINNESTIYIEKNGNTPWKLGMDTKKLHIPSPNFHPSSMSFGGFRRWVFGSVSFVVLKLFSARTVDDSEIPNNDLGCFGNPVNNGINWINYQPQLVKAGFQHISAINSTTRHVKSTRSSRVPKTDSSPLKSYPPKRIVDIVELWGVLLVFLGAFQR